MTHRTLQIQIDVNYAHGFTLLWFAESKIIANLDLDLAQSLYVIRYVHLAP